MKLPQRLLALLFENQTFKAIREIHVVKGIPLGKIEAKHYVDVADVINSWVKDFCRDKPLIRVKVDSEGMNERTLRNVLDLDEDITNANDKRRVKTINTLLLFLGVPEREWDSYRTDNHHNDIGDDYFLLLEGCWYVYRFDRDGKIIRTILQVKREKTASYRSLYSKLDYGRIEINGSLITINFVNTGVKSLEISVCVDESIIKDAQLLNGLIRSTTLRSNSPFAKHCILRKVSELPEIREFEELVTICHSSQIEKIKDTSVHERISYSPEEDIIVKYLNRQQKYIKARPFVPATISEADKRNFKANHSFERIAGQYFVYIPNAYKGEKSLFQIVLEIDPLGNVCEEILYEDDSGIGIDSIRSYQGHASIVSDTLRIVTENEYQLKCSYLFNINLKNNPISPTMIQGINLDTDKAGLPCADVCIAVRRKVLPIKYEPIVLKPGTEDYKTLDNFLKSKIKFSLQEYFFEYYPSIRYKKRKQGR